MISHLIPHPQGGDLHVYEYPGPDQAPALFLVHGAVATTWINWHRCLEDFQKHYRVLAIDLRGHGRGLPSNGGNPLEESADDIAIAIKGLEVSEVIVAGYSMGGPVTLLFARKYPELVKGVILSATTSDMTFLRADRMIPLLTPLMYLSALIWTLIPQWYIPLLTRNMHKRFPDFVDKDLFYNEMIRHRAFDIVRGTLAMSRFNAKNWLHEIQSPVVVTVTAQDVTVAPQSQRTMANRLPKGQIIEIEAPHEAAFVSSELYIPALLKAGELIRTQDYTP